MKADDLLLCFDFQSGHVLVAGIEMRLFIVQEFSFCDLVDQ